MAGLTAGVFDADVFSSLDYTYFNPSMDDAVRQKKYSGWLGAVRTVIGEH